MRLSDYLKQLAAPLFHEEGLEIYERILANEIPQLPQEALSSAESLLGLAYLETTGEGNLCFAEHQEVRPDFRTGFTARQFLDALYGSHSVTGQDLSGKVTPEKLSLPFPRTAADFWTLSEYGKRLRNLHSLDFQLSEKPGSGVDLQEVQELYNCRINGRFPFQEWRSLHEGRKLRPDQKRRYRKTLWALENTGRIREKISTLPLSEYIFKNHQP